MIAPGAAGVTGLGRSSVETADEHQALAALIRSI